MLSQDNSSSQIIYRFDVIPLKIPPGYFMDISNIKFVYSKVYVEKQKDPK